MRWVVVAFALLVAGCGAEAAQPTAPRTLETLGRVSIPAADAPVLGVDRTPVDNAGAPEIDDPATTEPTEPTGAAGARSDLRWTVIAVERDDVLNVRAEPSSDAPIVDTLAPWTTDLVVSDDSEIVGSGLWRWITTPAGVDGWVNARFLVAQPETLSTDDEAVLLSRTRELAQWAADGEGNEARLLAPRALWVGGLGIYGDGHLGWNWLPVDDVDDRSEWDDVRTFRLFEGTTELPCGADCESSLSDYLKFDRVDDDSRFLVNDIADRTGGGFYDGELYDAPASLHRVVVDTPADDPDVALDWQRIHVVFDWSGGRPQVLLIHTWGWTP